MRHAYSVELRRWFPIRESLRLRVALSYSLLLVVLLGLASWWTYARMAEHMLAAIDRELVVTAEHAAVMLGQADRPADLARLLIGMTAVDRSLRLLAADGRVLVRLGDIVTEPDAPDLGPPDARSKPRFRTLQGRHEGAPVRVRSMVMGIAFAGQPAWIEIQTPLASYERSLRGLATVGATATAAAGIVALLLASSIAGAALAPIAAVTRTARAIALSRGLSRRVPLPTYPDDELGKLTRAFNEMLAAIEQAYRLQQQFLADASHELRTPVATIKGNLDLLLRYPAMPEEEKRQTLATAQREAARMGRLVDDLLALARADAGQEIEHKPVDLDEVLLEAARSARVLAEGRLDVRIEGVRPTRVTGDRDRLLQLLLILLENAVRYTPDGGLVSLAMRRQADQVEVSVRDTGIGIPEAELGHIFDRFFRGRLARRRRAEGSGLGLAIAAWIAREHGCQIEVESKVGQGSTFRLRLPLLDSDETLGGLDSSPDGPPFSTWLTE